MGTQITFSAEKQFIHADSFNRGFVQLPRMIAACIGLSSEAKSVYSYISGYVYEHGRSAFPSIHRIAIACNMTGKSSVKYISELTDKGFVKKVHRGRGKTNEYYLNDAHEVCLLHISEMMWTALDGAVKVRGANSWEKAETALGSISEALKEKGLYFNDMDCSGEAQSQFSSELLSVMEGGKPTLTYIRSRPPVVAKTQSTPVASDKGKLHRLQRMEDTWGIDDFRQHFYDLYFDATGAQHMSTVTVHRGTMTRIIKQLDGDKSAMRKVIEAFFSIGYDIKTVEWFGTSGRLAEIMTFIKEGKKPFYLDPNNKKSAASTAKKKVQDMREAVQQDEGLDLEALKKRMGGK